MLPTPRIGVLDSLTPFTGGNPFSACQIQLRIVGVFSPRSMRLRRTYSRHRCTAARCARRSRRRVVWPCELTMILMPGLNPSLRMLRHQRCGLPSPPQDDVPFAAAIMNCRQGRPVRRIAFAEALRARALIPFVQPSHCASDRT